jgi:hypothetical protein
MGRLAFLVASSSACMAKHLVSAITYKRLLRRQNWQDFTSSQLEAELSAKILEA